MAKEPKSKSTVARSALVPVRTKKAAKKGLRLDGYGPTAPGRQTFALIPLPAFVFEKPRRPKGDAVQLEFSVPRRGVRPEDVGSPFAGLWKVEEELLPPNLGEGTKAAPGLYVTYPSLNSPLKIDLTLIGLPEGAAEAITQFLSDLVFRKQGRRLRDAQAAEAEERVRAMKIDSTGRTRLSAGCGPTSRGRPSASAP